MRQWDFVIHVKRKVNIDSNEKIKDSSNRFKKLHKEAKYFDKIKDEKANAWTEFWMYSSSVNPTNQIIFH